MATAEAYYPQHWFRDKWVWERQARLVSYTETSLIQRYAHKSRHHSGSNGVTDEVRRGIDSGIRSIARAANWIDKRIIGVYRSSRFARRRSESGDSSVYFD